MKLPVAVILIWFAVSGSFVVRASPTMGCGSSCNSNVQVAVCACKTGSHDGCQWIKSYCIWKKCYSDTHVLMPSSMCDRDTRPDTLVIKEGHVPPYTDNRHN